MFILTTALRHLECSLYSKGVPVELRKIIVSFAFNENDPRIRQEKLENVHSITLTFNRDVFTELLLIDFLDVIAIEFKHPRPANSIISYFEFIHVRYSPEKCQLEIPIPGKQTPYFLESTLESIDDRLLSHTNICYLLSYHP